MIARIYTVKDRATDSFMPPFYLQATGQAIRDFTAEVNNTENEKSQIAKYPDDHDLYELGEYNTETAKFTTHDPKLVVRGKDVKVQKQ